ncbi:MAG: hypothetical protein SVU32_08385, partial [Candidatus Nanohaloarchaea archaeon]|nr:hypothetical protein [Candidatus Nanohaloarchaea archaeon]
MTDDDQSEQYEKDTAEQEDNNIETYTDTESYDAGRERFQEAETLIEGDHDNVRKEGPHVLK